MRHDVGRQTLIVWSFVILSGILWMVFQKFRFLFVMFGNVQESEVDGVVIMASGVVAVLVVLVAYRQFWIENAKGVRSIHCTIRLSSRQSLDWRIWLYLFVAVLVFASVGNLFSQSFQGVLGVLGWPQRNDGAQFGQMMDGSISALLAVGVAGPVIEGVLLYGIVLPSLERYGRIFAIITASLLFGCIQGSITQGVSAMLIGLVLGWAASEYSVVWSMTLCAFYYLVVQEGISSFMTMLSDQTQNVIQYTFDVLLLVVGLVFFVVNRRKVTDWCASNRSVKHAYQGWRSPLFILTFVIFGFVAVTRLLF